MKNKKMVHNISLLEHNRQSPFKDLKTWENDSFCNQLSLNLIVSKASELGSTFYDELMNFPLTIIVTISRQSVATGCPI